MADSLVNEVRSGVADGKSLEQIQSSIDLSNFRTRFVAVDPLLGNDFDRHLPRAIANAYRKLTTVGPGINPVTRTEALWRELPLAR